MEKQVQVSWNKEKRSLLLEGEPVREYSLEWPEVTGGGLGGRWISRYYRHLARQWRRRWEREVYWCACLELSRLRSQAKPFLSWQGELAGEVTLLKDGLLSLRFQGWETRGEGRTARVRWGDVWQVREGAPYPLGRLMKGEKAWKKRLWGELVRQGEERRKAGDCFLDGDWPEKVRHVHPLRDYCLTEEGVEISLPQCAASPAAEGCPVFTLGMEPAKTQE